MPAKFFRILIAKVSPMFFFPSSLHFCDLMEFGFLVKVTVGLLGWALEDT